jgi:hypothetical protein
MSLEYPEWMRTEMLGGLIVTVLNARRSRAPAGTTLESPAA